MNIGIEDQIQKDLSEEQKKLARDFIDDIVTWPFRKGDCRWGTGASPNSFRRNILGIVINQGAPPEEQITFRRISKRRRVFGVVRVSLLKIRKKNDIKKYRNYADPVESELTSGCRCATCVCAFYVTMPEQPEMEFYYRYGQVKG